MNTNTSIGKGRTVNVPKPGDVIFGEQSAPLFQLFNAIMKMKIVQANTYDVQITENGITITVPSNSTNSGGTGVGPVWLP